jgi:hypothetical protein
MQVVSCQEAATGYNKNVPDDLERFANNNHPFCNQAHIHT